MIAAEHGFIAKGNERDDLELQRRVHNYLLRRLPNLRTIEVLARHGSVTLFGKVPSLSVQCRCIDCCRHVAGVLIVIDRLEVAAV